MGIPLTRQRLQNAFLKGVWGEVKKDRRAAVVLVLGPGKGAAKWPGLLRIVGNELPAVPVGLELDAELVQHMGHVLGGHFQVPLQPAGNGGLGHIGRTDVRGREPALAPEMVSLGMKPGPLGVKGDPHQHIREFGHPLHCGGVGRSHIRGGDQPYRHFPVTQVLEGRHQESQPRPLDERHQNIYRIGGAHLFQQLMG